MKEKKYNDLKLITEQLSSFSFYVPIFKRPLVDNRGATILYKLSKQMDIVQFSNMKSLLPGICQRMTQLAKMIVDQSDVQQEEEDDDEYNDASKNFTKKILGKVAASHALFEEALGNFDSPVPVINPLLDSASQNTGRSRSNNRNQDNVDLQLRSNGPAQMVLRAELPEITPFEKANISAIENPANLSGDNLHCHSMYRE